MRDFQGAEIHENDRVIVATRVGSYPGFRAATVVDAGKGKTFVKVAFADGQEVKVRPDKILIFNWGA